MNDVGLGLFGSLLRWIRFDHPLGSKATNIIFSILSFLSVCVMLGCDRPTSQLHRDIYKRTDNPNRVCPVGIDAKLLICAHVACEKKTVRSHKFNATTPLSRFLKGCYLSTPFLHFGLPLLSFFFLHFPSFSPLSLFISSTRAMSLLASSTRRAFPTLSRAATLATANSQATRACK